MALSIEKLKSRLVEKRYICDDGLAAALFVALTLERPLLVEGAAGVGKTELAKAMAQVLGRQLVRLQCHAGMDETRALYEWNYQKQLLAIQAHTSAGHKDADASLTSIFAEEDLLERPLLISVRSSSPVVLLIDELDKADEEFEAFLLELLSEFQVTIPELGTVKALSKPFVVLTSNSTRQLSDALRRRCVYACLTYPGPDKELRIIRARLPGADEALARSVTEAVAYIRKLPGIIKKPSIAETLDWLAALEALGQPRLTRDSVRESIGAVLKKQDDIDRILQDDEFLDLC